MSFRFYDCLLFSGDGLIQEKELAHVMRACMDENGMKFDEGEVDELTRYKLAHDSAASGHIPIEWHYICCNKSDVPLIITLGTYILIDWDAIQCDQIRRNSTTLTKF